MVDEAETTKVEEKGTVHSLKKFFGSGKKEAIFKKISLAILAIWVIVWATNRSYPFWPGLAGILTLPLLLLALVVDNIREN